MADKERETKKNDITNEEMDKRRAFVNNPALITVTEIMVSDQLSDEANASLIPYLAAKWHFAVESEKLLTDWVGSHPACPERTEIESALRLTKVLTLTGEWKDLMGDVSNGMRDVTKTKATRWIPRLDSRAKNRNICLLQMTGMGAAREELLTSLSKKEYDGVSRLLRLIENYEEIIIQRLSKWIDETQCLDNGAIREARWDLWIANSGAENTK